MAQQFRAYLNPLGYLETHYTRMMASLSSIAYRMERVTPAYLHRMHGLELRYTSLACELGLKPEPEAEDDLEAASLGDGVLQPLLDLIGITQQLQLVPDSLTTRSSRCPTVSQLAAVGPCQSHNTQQSHTSRSNTSLTVSRHRH